MTTIVADTGEIEQIRLHKPCDATTNPSLLLKAVQLPEYKPLLETAISEARQALPNVSPDRVVAEVIDRLAVEFGCKILEVVPGLVSTEIDARPSFDAESMVERARHIIRLYAAKGVDTGRVLIKLSTTWEGIPAAQ
eukprot:408303_1